MAVGPQRSSPSEMHRELERQAAGLPDAALHVLGQLAEVGVARGQLGPGVADADDRLALEDMVGQAQLALHPARCMKPVLSMPSNQALERSLPAVTPIPASPCPSVASAPALGRLPPGEV